MKREIFVSLSIAAFTLTVGSACAAQPVMAEAAVQEAYPAGNVGLHLRDGAEFAVKKIDDKGQGRAGSEHYPVALKVLDHQFSANPGVRQLWCGAH